MGLEIDITCKIVRTFPFWFKTFNIFLLYLAHCYEFSRHRPDLTLVDIDTCIAFMVFGMIDGACISRKYAVVFTLVHTSIFILFNAAALTDPDLMNNKEISIFNV